MDSALSLIDAAEVARVLGISRTRLASLLHGDEGFPSRETHGTRWMWRRESIERWCLDHPIRGDQYCRAALPAPGVMAPRVSAIAQTAHDEARLLNHSWVGVEHLLLALVAPDSSGLARRVLLSYGLSLQEARKRLEDAFGDPFEPTLGDLPPIPYSPRLQLVAERSYMKALQLQDEAVDSEHLLLALIDAWEDAPLLGRIIGGVVPGDLAFEVVAASEAALFGLGGSPSSAGLQLKASPLGLDPSMRRPWTARSFIDEKSGLPVKFDASVREYLVDRDGYPLVTKDGKFIDLWREGSGSMLASSDGTHFVAITVPVGAAASP